MNKRNNFQVFSKHKPERYIENKGIFLLLMKSDIKRSVLT